MSKRIQKHVHFLMLLADTEAPLAQKRSLINQATPNQLLALKEVIVNLVVGNIPLSESQKQKFREHKKLIEDWGDTEFDKPSLVKKIDIVILIFSVARPYISTV